MLHELDSVEDALSKSEARRAEPFILNYMYVHLQAAKRRANPRVVCECRRHELNAVEEALSISEAVWPSYLL